MTKITLNNVGSLIDATTAQNTINGNNGTLVTAFDNTLSRDGTVPNTMSSQIDMNSNAILNLPAPTGPASPLRLQDLSTFTGGGTVTNIPTGGTTGQALKKASNVDFATTWGNDITSVGLAMPTQFTVTNSPVTSSGTLTAAWQNQAQSSVLAGPASGGAGAPAFRALTTADLVGTATGTGNIVLQTSPTINTPILTAPVLGTPASGNLVNCTGISPTFSSALTVTSNSANSLTVGPSGSTNPILSVDSATASAVAGLKVTGAATGGTVTLQATDSGALANIFFDAKGGGSVLLGRNSTGGVNLGGSSNNAKLIFNGSTSGFTTVIPLVAASGTLTLPSATDTLVGKATTDTLTNKTLTSPILTTPSLGVATATTINGAALDNLAWTSFTPVITAGAGTFTTVTPSAFWKQIGKTIFIRMQIIITTVGTASGAVIATLPVNTGPTFGTFIGGQEISSKVNLGSQAGASAGTLSITKYDGTSIIGPGNTLFINGTYESA